MVRGLLTIALLLVAVPSARAQIIEGGGSVRRVQGPNAWASLGIGWLNQDGLCDPGSNSCWDLGNAVQWRASLEMPIGRGATIGGAATTARVPMRYASTTSCVTSCDADANISQYLGLLHIGGGRGIHQNIDIALGATVFTNFRETSGTRLPPAKAVTNFTFSIGYGLGIPISQNFHMTLSQEYGQIVGRRMPGRSKNSAGQNVTRLGARVGLGL